MVTYSGRGQIKRSFNVIYINRGKGGKGGKGKWDHVLIKTFVNNKQRDFLQHTILLHTYLWSLVINILKWFWGFWLLFFLLDFWAMSCHGFHQLFNVFTGILQNDNASNGQLLNRARNEDAQAPLIFPECSTILIAYSLNGTPREREWFGSRKLELHSPRWQSGNLAFAAVWFYTSNLTVQP